MALRIQRRRQAVRDDVAQASERVEAGAIPWLLEVSKCAAQEAIINLGVSFSNFFRDCKKKAQRRFHYPKPKKKGVHDSFCAANEVGTFRCDGKRVKLPVVGWVRMRE